MSHFSLNHTLHQIKQSWPVQSWEVTCLEYMQNDGYTFQQGLRDSAGRPTSNLSDAWGVTFAVCMQYCSNIPFSQIFSFDSFASSLTNYFLPWLALTAQLPFESGSRFGNFISFCLAVGSPALVTYSLALTLLNRHWIHGIFKKLKDAIEADDEHESSRGEFKKKTENLQFLLQEGMQVPLRASQKNDAFASMIAHSQLNPWLHRLHKQLEVTKRGVTASLFAQMLFAVVAYLFVVISSFGTDLGNPEVALQIASGSLWIWLVPVVSGWIVVGTQVRADSITDAILSDDPEAGRPSRRGSMSVEARRGSMFAASRRQSSLYISGHPNESTESRVLIWRGFEVNGDERMLGPLFNYARVFTWAQLARTVTDALRTVQQEKRGFAVFASSRRVHLDDTGNSALGQYCGLGRIIPTYPDLAKDTSDRFSAKLKQRIFFAACMAVFLQWGTTGSSILVAYLTPAIGLGCRSTGYLLYGSLGTAAWGCLLLSSLVSEHIMVRDQRRHPEQRSPPTATSADPEQGPPSISPLGIHTSVDNGQQQRNSDSGDSPVQNSQHLSPRSAVRRSSHSADAQPPERVLDRRRRSSSVSPFRSGDESDEPRPSSEGAGESAIRLLPLRQPTQNRSDLADPNADDETPAESAPDSRDRIYADIAIALWILGRILAILNTIWLLVSSLFEFTGVYDNCYCQSDKISTGNKAWVVLFKGTNDVLISDTANFIGGIVLALSLGTCGVAFFMLYMINIESPQVE